MITLSATIAKSNGEIININNSNALSIETSISDRKDLTIPIWGIVSNQGELRFIDANGTIKRMMEQKELSSGLEVKIYINSTMGCSEELCQLETSKWEYDNDNKNVVVSIKDGLETLQDIAIGEHYYDFDFVERDIPLSNIYKYLYNFTPPKFNFLSFEDLDTETQNVLNARKVKFYISSVDNLWGAWNELAVATFSHIYKHKGKTIFKYKGGN